MRKKPDITGGRTAIRLTAQEEERWFHDTTEQLREDIDEVEQQMDEAVAEIGEELVELEQRVTTLEEPPPEEPE